MNVKNKRINLNKFAKKITDKEGKKESLSIAQVKEVMRLIFKKLAKMDALDVLRILARYK